MFSISRQLKDHLVSQFFISVSNIQLYLNAFNNFELTFLSLLLYIILVLTAINNNVESEFVVSQKLYILNVSSVLSKDFAARIVRRAFWTLKVVSTFSNQL